MPIMLATPAFHCQSNLQPICSTTGQNEECPAKTKGCAVHCLPVVGIFFFLGQDLHGGGCVASLIVVCCCKCPLVLLRMGS